MAQRTFSVYVGEKHIRVVEFQRASKKKLIINRIADVEIPAGSVQDGMIMDIDSVAAQLGSCIHGMSAKAKSIIFTISSKKISTKEVDIPYIKQKEKINELLSVNPQDYFPMSNTEDYLYSHTRLQTITGESGNKQLRIMAVAMPRAIVEAYYTVAQKLGLKVEAIDYTGNSILQVMKKSLTADNNLLVQIENDVSFVSIVVNGVVVLQRSISYGLHMAISAFAELRGITEKQASIIFRENKESITEKEYEEIVFPLMNGISRFLDFYTSRNGALEIQSISIYSTSGVKLPIGNILQNAIGGEAVYIKELQGVTFGKGIMANEKQLLRYMSCIGAGIEPMSFQLGEEESQEEKDDKAKKSLVKALIAAGAVAAVMVIGTIAFYFVVLSQKKEIMNKIRDLESIRKTVVSYEQAKSEYDTLLAFYETTGNDNEKLYDFILELEKVMPESMGITNLQTSSGMVSMNGECQGKEVVAEFIIQLKSLPYIDNVFVTNISETYDEFNIPKTTFALSCTMQNRMPEEMTEAEGIDAEKATKTEETANEAE